MTGIAPSWLLSLASKPLLRNIQSPRSRTCKLVVLLKPQNSQIHLSSTWRKDSQFASPQLSHLNSKPARKKPCLSRKSKVAPVVRCGVSRASMNSRL